MKKSLTIGLLLTMLSMPSNVNAQRFLERVNNTLERINQTLEQVQETATTPSSTISSTTDAGVVINGVRWATRNVDVPGTFAARPNSSGQFFQWNRQQGWSATTPGAGVAIHGWNPSAIGVGYVWEPVNDPCPKGWRIPTPNELAALQSSFLRVVVVEGAHGAIFGSYPNSIVVPLAGGRDANTGRLFPSGRVALWASTFARTSCSLPDVDYGIIYWNALWITEEGILETGLHPSFAFPVRCVAE